MHHSIQKLIPGFLALALFAAIAGFAQAHDTGTPHDEPAAPASVSYPIAELGGCTSKTECKTYCDDASHHDACYAFAEASGLMSKTQVAAARTILKKAGPGGCSDRASCSAYCQASANTAECISFAQKYNAIATSTAVLIKKIKIEGGPGGCKSGEECKTYCSDTSHLTECRQFGQNAGIIKKPEDTRVAAILAQKPGPGGCATQDECKVYCADNENGTECRQFAADNGLITKEQLEKSEKAANLTGPGGCRGSDCKLYCSDSSHKEECYSFAVKNGLIATSTAERARSLDAALKVGAGPGGCTGPDACRAYCADTEHQSECRAFAEKNKLEPTQTPRPAGAHASSTGEARKMLPPAPSMPQTPEAKAAYCKEHPVACATGMDASKPNTALPKPPIAPKPPTGTSSTADLTCKSIDECRALCAKSAEACAKLPPDVRQYILNTKPTTNTTLPPKPATETTTAAPPPQTNTTPPAGTTGDTGTSDAATTPTTAPCNTLAECKILCTTKPAACAGFPPETLKYILESGTTAPPPTNTTQPPSGTRATSNLGAALMTAVAQLLGF